MEQYGFWDRQIRKYGGRARHGVNAFVARYSKIGDPAIFDPTVFPWTSRLAAGAEIMRTEAGAVVRRAGELPSIVELSPDHEGINRDRGWKSFFLYGYGVKIEENCAQCPRTTALVEQVPGLLTAMFSVHAPGTHLSRHRGVTKGMITAHLPLRTPKEAEAARIEVEDETHVWREGRFFIFDDTREHEVWNDSDEPRINLLLHVRRPLKQPGGLVQDAFFGAIKHTAFVKDAERNIRAWSERFARMEEPVGEVRRAS